MGIYFHIPFCRKACHYCDFHFSTSLQRKDELLQSMHNELQSRKEYLSQEIKTIYFGGGTPSILPPEEIAKFLNQVHSLFTVNPDAEITLEGNPEDLTKEKMAEWNNYGINRLSIGIQSFRNEDLVWMNRSHTVQEAVYSVKCAQDTGIKNITIDLIYGIPGMSDEEWISNLETAVSLGVSHISAYCLTVEPGTALDHFVKNQKSKPVNEEQASKQFLLMLDFLRKNGFIAYEISNFGKEGFFSKHNSSYWKGEPYLGIGPSAHSYNGISRRFNIANNARYIKNMKEGSSYSETENLTEQNKYNEYIMTRLRTIWGVNEKYIAEIFGTRYSEYFSEESAYWKKSGHLKLTEGNFILSDEGRLIADKIISELFIS